MTKEEIIEKLLASGKTEEELKGLKKAELEALLPEESEELIEIISKRKDEPCYWLANGEKLPYEEVEQFKRRPVDFCPPHKAKDYALKTNEGWQLKFRHEVEA